MYARTLITLILVTMISIPAASRPRVQPQDDRAEEQDRTLLPYDQYEAQKIARAFKEELEKGNDIAPLIDKYFVNDFDERFTKEAPKTCWFPAKPTALAQADKKDVRDYFIALTNFEFLYVRLLFALDKQQKERLLVEGKESDEEVIDAEKLVPNEVLDAFKTNQFLFELIPEDARDKSIATTDTDLQVDASTSSETETSGTDEREIDTIEKLRDLSSAMKFAAGRMHNYLSTLPDDKIALDYIMPQESDSETFVPSYDVFHTAYISNEEEFYGVPKGTRLVCARVLYLHIDMVRIDGDLKVLAIYMPAGD